jgi:hypothetical protein
MRSSNVVTALLLLPLLAACQTASSDVDGPAASLLDRSQWATEPSAHRVTARPERPRPTLSPRGSSRRTAARASPPRPTPWARPRRPGSRAAGGRATSCPHGAAPPTAWPPHRQLALANVGATRSPAGLTSHALSGQRSPLGDVACVGNRLRGPCSHRAASAAEMCLSWSGSVGTR